MYSIKLSGLKFHAPIGLYPEEQILGNEIEINLQLSRTKPLNVAPFLDYAKLYELIAAEAKERDSLLENLQHRILDKINICYPGTGIRLEIRKNHPPFGGIAAFAGIIYDNISGGHPE